MSSHPRESPQQGNSKKLPFSSTEAGRGQFVSILADEMDSEVNRVNSQIGDQFLLTHECSEAFQSGDFKFADVPLDEARLEMSQRSSDPVGVVEYATDFVALSRVSATIRLSKIQTASRI
jgi:hypothetical protein